MDQEQFFKMQNSKLFIFFDRLLHLTYVNVLMIGFSILGLFVFGFYPAVFAAAGIFNQTLEAKEGNTFRRFFEFFRKYFVIGNLCMMYTAAVAAAGYFLIFRLPEESIGIGFTMLFFLLLCGLLAAVIWNIYLPYLSVMYPSFSIKRIFLFSLAAAFTKWKLTIGLFLLFCSGVALVLVFPSVMIFLAVSVIPFVFTFLIKKTMMPDTLKCREEREQNSTK